MKYSKLLTEMTWNEEDIKIASQAQGKLDDAVDAHNDLMSKVIVPKRKKLVYKLNGIERQEDGQGQRGDEVAELKSAIKELDNMATESQDIVARLMVSVKRINQMRQS